MIRFFRSLAPGGIAVVAGLALALILGAVLLWNAWGAASTAKTEARLGANQTDAAIKSGQDATGTVGEQAKNEAARERSVAEMQKEVNDADNDSGAHAAGAGWLCDDFGICS